MMIMLKPIQLFKYSLIGLCILLFGVHVKAIYHHGPLGDEPHYLLMAESLVQDGDFDLKNDYTQERYKPYFAAKLDPHINRGKRKEISWHSIHGVGLPILIMPGFLWNGAKGATLVMAAISALLLAATYLWTRGLSGQTPALLSTCLLLISPLFLSNSGFIFPDIPIALCAVLTVYFASQKPSIKYYLLISTTMSCAIWLHYKTIIIFLPLLLFLTSKNVKKRSWTLVLALILPYLLNIVVFEMLTWKWFGMLIPYQGTSSQLAPLGAIQNSLGLILDAGKGVLINYPAILVILIGLPIWAKIQSETFRLTALVVVPALLLYASFSEWPAGFCPPARYFLDILPLLTPALALAVERVKSRVLYVVLVVVAIYELAISLIGIKLRWPFYNLGTSSPELAHLHINAGAFLPSFSQGLSLHNSALSLAWILFMSIFLLWGTRSLSRKFL